MQGKFALIFGSTLLVLGGVYFFTQSDSLPLSNQNTDDSVFVEEILLENRYRYWLEKKPFN